MAIQTITIQEPIYERRRLGSIPKDSYVEDKPFVPNLAPDYAVQAGAGIEVEDGLAVEGNVPLRNAGGTLQLIPRTVSEDVKAYNPLRRAAGCALVGGFAGAVAGGVAAGIPGLVLGGLASAAGAAALGAWSAHGDVATLQAVPLEVTEPVLTGFTASSVDGAFVPTRPRAAHPLLETGGRLHFYVPTIEDRPVGLAEAAQVVHTRYLPETAAAAALVGGAALGAALPLVLGLV